MNLQELSYFSHVNYYYNQKVSAQIKIRKWYQFMKLKSSVRMFIYTGAYVLNLKYKYTIHASNIFFRSDTDTTELVFTNCHELREYLLLIILRSISCYFVKNDTYDMIFLIQ
jgi:hypothetical protein